MRVVVDAAKCLGNGLCEAIAGELFAVGEDSLARVLPEAAAPQHRDALAQAVRMCPTQAIALED